MIREWNPEPTRATGGARPDVLFAGGGEMRALCRDFPWAATPLGSADSWPASLRTIVATLLASRHPMFLWWGPDLVQVYNDAYRLCLGDGERHPRALGQRGAECWPEIWDIIGPQIQQVMAGGEATWHEDHLVPIERNGRLEDVWWTYSYSPAFDDEGAVGGVLVICQETTRRVQSSRERERLIAAEREARTDAERANEGKSQFLAVMSHELRTPLNAIGGYAELIEMGIHGPVTLEQGDALRRIRKSQRHLMGLVNEVLEYARVESGHVDYHVSDVALDQVLAICETLIAPQLLERRLTLVVPECPPYVSARADAEKVQQVLLNLLSNAAKFTEAGGTISLWYDATAGFARISVRDTGRGIATDQLTRIFEPFVQVGTRIPPTRQGVGVGLGLAISRDLARGMGGDLTVASELGVGSTFTLVLQRSA